MKIGRLFIGSEPTNTPEGSTIASWQAAGTIAYWRWAVRRRPYRYWKPGIQPGFYKNHFCPGGGKLRHPFSIVIYLPWIGQFSFITQPALKKGIKL